MNFTIGPFEFTTAVRGDVFYINSINICTFKEYNGMVKSSQLEANKIVNTINILYRIFQESSCGSNIVRMCFGKNDEIIVSVVIEHKYFSETTSIILTSKNEQAEETNNIQNQSDKSDNTNINIYDYFVPIVDIMGNVLFAPKDSNAIIMHGYNTIKVGSFNFTQISISKAKDFMLTEFSTLSIIDQLKQFPKLDTLVIEDFSRFPRDILTEFTSITKIFIYRSSGLVSLDYLLNIPIKILCLNGCKLIDGLENLKNIKTLEIVYYKRLLREDIDKINMDAHFKIMPLFS